MVYLRYMIRGDLDRVLAIERASFEFPWDREQLAGSLKQERVVGVVAERSGRIAGFAVYQFHGCWIELWNMAADPEDRRCGVGLALVAHLVARLDGGRRLAIYAGVRERNLGAQLFFRAMGFRYRKTVVRPYEETDEDAYILRYTWQPRQMPLGLQVDRRRLMGLCGHSGEAAGRGWCGG